MKPDKNAPISPPAAFREGPYPPPIEPAIDPSLKAAGGGLGAFLSGFKQQETYYILHICITKHVLVKEIDTRSA